MNTLPPQVLNLRRIWKSKQNEMQFTQTDASKKLDWSQGAISHYLNNITELGPAAVIKFANFLHVDPEEIDPEITSYLNTYKTYTVANIIVPESDDYTVHCINSVTKKVINKNNAKTQANYSKEKTYNLKKSPALTLLQNPLKITGTNYWVKPPNCPFDTYLQITDFNPQSNPKLLLIWNLDNIDKKFSGYLSTYQHYKENPPQYKKFKVRTVEGILHY